jgi:formylglycine-generating enzyme required for sulfatase activity
VAALACNALSGADSLSVCEGADCDKIGTGPGTSSSSSGDNGDGGTGGTDAGEDATLPATCNGDEKRCAGSLSAHCVNGSFQTTQCAETCDTATGDCAPFPSCRNASGNACGPGGDAGSCCESIAVPGGTFNRNNDNTKTALVTGFKLDKLEVTVARFRAFVDANEGTISKPPPTGGGVNAKIANSGWNAEWSLPSRALLAFDTNALKNMLAGGTFTAMPGANETLPIVNVTWFEAFAFCIWDGGRLPTNAEWNYAAAGGSEQRTYPWTGTTIDDTYANFDCDYNGVAYSCSPVFGLRCADGTTCGTQGALCGDGSTCNNVQTGTSCTGCATFPAEVAPVGRFSAGAGKWGHLDLAGNVDEWVLDAAGNKDNIVLPTPCNDCAQLVPANPEGAFGGGSDDTYMIRRGGSWNTLDTTTPLRTNSSGTEHFQYKSTSLGFRCARNTN